MITQVQNKCSAQMHQLAGCVTGRQLCNQLSGYAIRKTGLDTQPGIQMYYLKNSFRQLRKDIVRLQKIMTQSLFHLLE